MEILPHFIGETRVSSDIGMFRGLETNLVCQEYIQMAELILHFNLKPAKCDTQSSVCYFRH